MEKNPKNRKVHYALVIQKKKFKNGVCNSGIYIKMYMRAAREQIMQ